MHGNGNAAGGLQRLDRRRDDRGPQAGRYECYTKFTNLRGAGECSEPHLDTQIWPGTNSMLLVCVEPGQKEALLEAVRRMKDIHREEGVRAFVLPVTRQSGR